VVDIATFYDKVERESGEIEGYIRNKLDLLKDIFLTEERIRSKGLLRVESLLNSSSRSINNEIKEFKIFKQGWRNAFMNKRFTEIAESLNRQNYEAKKEDETLFEIREVLNAIKDEIDIMNGKIKKFGKYNKKNYRRMNKLKKGFEVIR